MCPDPSWVKIYCQAVRCDQMMGMSRMCWSILSDKGLYLCHSKCRPPEMTSGQGQAQDDDYKLSESSDL